MNAFSASSGSNRPDWTSRFSAAAVAAIQGGTFKADNYGVYSYMTAGGCSLAPLGTFEGKVPEAAATALQGAVTRIYEACSFQDYDLRFGVGEVVNESPGQVEVLDTLGDPQAVDHRDEGPPVGTGWGGEEDKVVRELPDGRA